MCDWESGRFGMDDDQEEQQNVVPDTDELRYGGAQADDDEEKRKERERKKAEVRRRLEEAGKKQKKKGFLTPERKKKLRQLLMKKAAEDLKQQQLVKQQERQRILIERTIKLPEIDSMDAGALDKLAIQLRGHLLKLEAEKYEFDYQVKEKEFEINELTIAVNDLRGKFVKPTLKKVSKYDNNSDTMIRNQEVQPKIKWKKMGEKKEDKMDFRSNLKSVKKKDDLLEFVTTGQKEKADGPDWAKKGGREAGEAEDE